MDSERITAGATASKAVDTEALSGLRDWGAVFQRPHGDVLEISREADEEVAELVRLRRQRTHERS